MYINSPDRRLRGLTDDGFPIQFNLCFISKYISIRSNRKWLLIISAMSTYLQMFFQLYHYCSRVTLNYNKKFCMAFLEAVVQRCSEKKNYMQNSQENTCVGETCNFIKKRLQYKCFPVNFMKFLGMPILKNIYERPLLHFKYYTPANNTAKAVAKYSKTATARGRNIVWNWGVLFSRKF